MRCHKVYVLTGKFNFRLCHTEMCDIMEMEKIVLIHDSLMRKEVDAFPMDGIF